MCRSSELCCDSLTIKHCGVNTGVFIKGDFMFMERSDQIVSKIGGLVTDLHLAYEI